MKNNLSKVNRGIFFWVFLTLVFFIAFLIKKPGLTDVEKLYINKEESNLLMYLNHVDKTDDLDHKIVYALSTNLAEGTDKMSIDEIVTFINNTFDKKVKKGDIEKIGISPYMLENQVVYNLEKQQYQIKINDYTSSDIANIKLYKYINKKIKKTKKDVFVVTYDKYVVDNPHSVYNYYLANNNSNDEKKDNLDKVDLNDLSDYLKGESNRKNIDKYLTKQVLKSVGKKETIKIKYKVIDNKLKISEIK